jgi:hypothetical protein
LYLDRCFSPSTVNSKPIHALPPIPASIRDHIKLGRRNSSPSSASMDEKTDSMEKGEPIILPNGREVSPVDATRRGSSSAAKILHHSSDADEAMKAFVDGEVPELTPETNARLLKIIDWHLMPLMCLVYGLNYLDKVRISFHLIQIPSRP